MREATQQHKCTDFAHTAVMRKEMLQYLAPRAGEHFLDCTFGAGGYSKAILDSCSCEVTALDQDPTVGMFVDSIKMKHGARFNFKQIRFADATMHLTLRQFNGIVLDLGMSSMQVDSIERGFSFTHDGPLDMRMSCFGPSAADFINNATEQEISKIIYEYGEEKSSHRIAQNIISCRQQQPIITTGRLAKIVRSAIGYRQGKIDPATKTFQAIRIYINRELDQLKLFLEKVDNLLAPNGRLIVVSFHSLEDAIVKNYFREHTPRTVARSKYAIRNEVRAQNKFLDVLTKKPITPSLDEVLANPRSRSAKLRAAIMVKQC